MGDLDSCGLAVEEATTDRITKTLMLDKGEGKQKQPQKRSDELIEKPLEAFHAKIE